MIRNTRKILGTIVTAPAREADNKAKEMPALEQLKRSPTTITLCGWLLFHAWLFSVVGLVLSAIVVAHLAAEQELSGRAAATMGAMFVGAALTCCAVYPLALRSWGRHFLANMRSYRLVDIVLAPIIGLALAGTIAICLC